MAAGTAQHGTWGKERAKISIQALSVPLSSWGWQKGDVALWNSIGS